VRATLDAPDADASAVVVACPPHPQHGGHRGDSRLRAVGDALGERGVACLRFDYGAWDEGRRERRDALNAVAWASDRYARVGLFGYCFGGARALRAPAERPVRAVSALAPAGTLGGESVAPAVERIDAPVQVLYGERDTTVDSEAIADRARERGGTVAVLSADHFFVGAEECVGDRIADFLAAHC
jgi:alpha/beta superfamily hydrolase